MRTSCLICDSARPVAKSKSSLEPDLLADIERRLEVCNGSDAMHYTQILLEQCRELPVEKGKEQEQDQDQDQDQDQEKKKKDNRKKTKTQTSRDDVKKKGERYRPIFGDRIPFGNHVTIFASFLRNQNKTDERQLETAFLHYVTQISHSQHERRLTDKSQKFLEWFEGPPPLFRQKGIRIPYMGFGNERGKSLAEYLKFQVSVLSQHDFRSPKDIEKARKLSDAAQKLFDEIVNARRESGNNAHDFSSDLTPTLFEAIHRMLYHHLDQFQKLMLRKDESSTTGLHLLDATDSYLKLTYFVEKMSLLIRHYFRVIDETPAVTSNLLIPPTPTIRDCDESLAGNSSIENAVDDTLIPNEDPDSPDINEPVEDYQINTTNTWGTCANKWLYNLIGQAHAAKLLFRERRKYTFTTNVISSEAPAESSTPWEQQTELKKRIGNPHTFDQSTFDRIQDIIIHGGGKFEFNGAFHAELIVAAELLTKSTSPQILIGVSRPPCFVCHQALRAIADYLRRNSDGKHDLRCCPTQSSCKVWKVDLPSQLPLEILEETLEKLSGGAARTFGNHHHIIEEIAEETRHYTNRLRANSANSTGSDELVDASQPRDDISNAKMIEASPRR